MMGDAGWVIVVTGPTGWQAAECLLFDELAAAPPGSILVHGDASAGADRMADDLASGLPIYRVRVPYYGRGGRAGGPMRNGLLLRIARMLAVSETRPLVLLACGAPGGDAGTDDCVAQAKRLGFPEPKWLP